MTVSEACKRAEAARQREHRDQIVDVSRAGLIAWCGEEERRLRTRWVATDRGCESESTGEWSAQGRSENLLQGYQRGNKRIWSSE